LPSNLIILKLMSILHNQ